MEGKPADKRIRIAIDALFILSVCLFLIYGAIHAVLFPTEVNAYENRSANQFPAFTGHGFLSGGDQDAVEDALTDQVFLAQSMEETYYRLDTGAQMRLIRPFLESHRDRYIGVLGLYTFGGAHLVNPVMTLEEYRDAFNERIAQLNRSFSAHPELTFYAYYIERDADLNLSTGEKAGSGDYIMAGLTLPARNKGIFRIDSYAELDEKFFRTDHHWNNRGAYEGYCDILRILKPDESPLIPRSEQTLAVPFSGSNAATTGARGVFTEPFNLYAFDFPPMDVTAEGKRVDAYGNQSAWLAGDTWGALSYSSVYGQDMAEVIFDTHRPEQGRILVLGESYDNPILPLLASHFGQTYSIDLRYYERVFGSAFDLGAYTREHGIDRVLLVGNLKFYALPEFELEG